MKSVFIPKKFKECLLLILFVFPILISATICNGEENNFSRNLEANKDYKLNRQKWIEMMHRHEEGINPGLMDKETKLAKRQQRQKLAGQNFKDGSRILNTDIDIANGHLTGRWLERGSNNLAGRIMTADLDLETNTIYAASAGGNIWKGSFTGRGWRCLNDLFQFDNVRLLRVFRIDGNIRILVVEGRHVYYSDNDGITWQTAIGLENPAGWGWFGRAVVSGGESPEIFILGGEWDYENWQAITTIYCSKDMGESFSQVYKTDLGDGYCDLWTSRYEKTDVLFVHADTLSKIYSDGSMELISAYTPVIGSDRISEIFLQGSDNYDLALALIDNSSDSTFFMRSYNGGKEWQYKGKLPFHHFDINSFAVSTFNADFMFFGGVDLYSSYDGGVSWRQVNNWWDYYNDMDNKLHADIPGVIPIRKDDENELIIIGTDGGLYYSDNYTESVKNISLGDLNVSQYYSVLSYNYDPQVVFAGSQDQGFQRCIYPSDTTLSFEQTVSGDYGHLTSSDGCINLWYVYPGFAELTIDPANLVMTGSYSLDFPGKGGLWMPPILADPEEPQAAYLACGGTAENEGGSFLWRLKYEFGSIKYQTLPYDFSEGDVYRDLSALAISSLDNNKFYALTSDGNFFHSSDKGSSWIKTEEFAGPETHYFYGSCIKTSEITPGKIYIAGSGYSNPAFFISEDDGATFTRGDEGLPQTLIFEIAVTPDDEFVFAATEVGPYVYVSRDNRWYDMMGGQAPDQTYWTVEYIPSIQTARFGTYGRGIWDFKISRISEVEDNRNIPSITGIGIGASPNIIEAGGNANITVNLPREGETSVNVYDINGNLIKNLYKGNLPAAASVFQWDGSSKAGLPLPAGFYICTVKSNGAAAFTKLKILK